MARIRLGNYAKLSATYYRDDAVLLAGERAELLFVRGLAFCSEAFSDGYMTDAQVHRVVASGLTGVKARIDALLQHGLWQRVDGGYQVRSWTRWHGTAADADIARRRDRERKAAARATESARTPDAVRPDNAPESDRTTPRSPGHISPDSLVTRQDKTQTRQIPPDGGAVQLDSQPDPAPPDTAQALVADWLDHCTQRPPSRVVSHVGRELRTLLDDGIDPADLRRGLATWHARRLHPSTLASVVNETIQGPPPARLRAVADDPDPHYWRPHVDPDDDGLGPLDATPDPNRGPA